MNYVLIDLENVMPKGFSRLNREDFLTFLFAGKSQEKLKLSTAMAVQPLGDKVKWIQMNGSGNNALDFHLAFYLGKIYAEDPKGCFYFVSNDKGFDPLVAHVKALGGNVERVDDINKKIPVSTGTESGNSSKQKFTVKQMAEELRKRKCRKEKSCKKAIKAYFNKTDDEEVERIFTMMVGKKLLTVNENGHITWPESE